MAQYFFPFPKVEYDLKKNGGTELLTNVTLRFKIRDILRSRVAVYNDYYIKEGERADIIAFNFYEDPSLDWLIYIVNNIIDPHYDWPLDYQSFTNYIKEKYGSVSAAQGTVHHYEWIYQAQQRLYDGTIIPEKTYEVDATTYATLAPTARKSVSVYDYEENLNDDKRRIKLLDDRYVNSITSQISGIFNE